MKNKKMPIFCGVIFALLVILVFVLWQQKKAKENIAPNKAGIANATKVTMNMTPNIFAPSNVQQTQPANNARVSNKTAQDKGNQMKAGLAVLNDVPIAFYGRLEDQFGNPVANARIDTSIRIYNGLRSTVERTSVISDTRGFFQITNGKGESLSIVPSKTGYVLATRNTYYKYSYMYPDRFSPNQNAPTVIKMWKLQGAEPLTGISKEYKLPFKDAPICFDIIAGKIVPAGGDVRIMVNRPAGNVSEHNPQNWGFEIDVVDGGLIETSDDEGGGVTFVAPENGYQSHDALTTAINRHGIGVIQQLFFIQSRNKQVYSKLGISFYINATSNDLMYIQFSGVANTNFSRNWEATAPQQ